MLTPEERAAIERRLSDLRSRMEKLDHLRIGANISEWAALYEECEALEKQFGDDL
jgi:hypothetical protein